MSYLYDSSCKTCGQYYTSSVYHAPCPRCAKMLTLHADLPTYIEACVEQAIDRLESKLESKIDALEWEMKHNHE